MNAFTRCLIAVALSLFFVGGGTTLARPRVQVVTTTQDLADIAREVGGDLVEATAIAKGYQDPHQVETKPSYIMKLQKADLFVELGLDMEVGFAPSLLGSSRNGKIQRGSPGFVDAYQGVPLMEVRPRQWHHHSPQYRSRLEAGGPFQCFHL
ncbi:MAG: zinc ABC transporter substrate-binding protein [Armatimonadetes bacterium]|nr:zinc ABC transporter substrate-binding protein [Armatimonadota bacterium]